MVWCGFENEDHNYICFEEIGLRAQNMITILNSIINIVE